MSKKKGLVLSILGVLSLVLITAGVTYAFFNYAKEGTTENTVTTGTITFIYEEVEAQGAGIAIEDAYPMSDTLGKAQSGSGKVFNFKVKSETTKSKIPYTVTARMKTDSTLSQDAVKLYLTEVSGSTETPILLDKYSNLQQTSITVPEGTVEKVIHTDTVPANSNTYEKNFRLRMWIDEKVDFSPVQDEEGNITYPYNDKKFAVTINVYANAKVVTDEEIAYTKNTEISNLSVGGTTLTKVEGQAYDYEMVVENGTTSTTISVETENPNAVVNIEKIDSLAYSSNIKRLSTTKTVELTEGDNYFKVTVTSEDKKVISTYTIKINVEERPIVGTEPYKAYNVGDAVTAVDGSKWHVLEDSNGNSEYVTLLSDYNIEEDGSYNTGCGMEANGDSYCSTMSLHSSQVAYYYSDTKVYSFINNTYGPIVQASLPGTTNVTIPTSVQIVAADGQSFTGSGMQLRSSWLTTTDYWTQDVVNSYDGSTYWGVYGYGNELKEMPISDQYSAGVRPVITTPKSNLVAE